MSLIARVAGTWSFTSQRSLIAIFAITILCLLGAGQARADGWQPACNPLVPPPCSVVSDGSAGAVISLNHNYPMASPTGGTHFGTDSYGHLSLVSIDGYQATIIPHYVGGAAVSVCSGSTFMTFTGCSNGPAGPQGRPNCCSAVGEPINLLTGEVYEEVTDFTTHGQSPLSVTRSYNSDLTYVISAPAAYSPNNAAWQSRFGMAWRSQYDSFIVDIGGLSTSSTDIDAVRGDGNPVHFKLSSGVWYVAYWDPSTGNWSGPTDPRHDVDLRFSGDGTYWYVQDKDDTVNKYDMSGKLVRITYRGGYYQTLSYDTSGNNTGITDSLGRSLTITYLANGLVNTITDPTSGVTHYAYVDRSGASPSPAAGDPGLWMLESVTYPDSRIVTYLYEDTNPINRYALTGIIDENGNRFTTWTYDSTTGRALSSQNAGGADLTTISYDDTANTRTVTNALGKQSVYHLAVFQGANQLQSIVGVASAHVPAATVSYTHDSNGYISQTTSGAGRVNTFVNNAIGQETSRTEGYGTLTARTISTTWDTSWREPAQIVAPNLTTDFAYDASGRLSLLTLTDTTTGTIPYSSAGQTRTWAYTYYTNGLLHTADGPLSGTGDTITYAYDGTGFVDSVTDVLGHTTTIGSNNGWGAPLSSVDPNGITTDYTYDLRGRINSVTVNPGTGQAQTGFTYDYAGNLTIITRPDGSTLTYTYDNAHRVTSVTNNLGESVTYTLDALGNHTATVTRSTTSTITKQESATFDELGRIMASIGAASQTTSFAYDLDNNQTSITDPRTKVYGYAFDALNRLYEQTDPNSYHTTTVIDAQDNQTSVTDARSLVTTYIRNGFGDVKRQISPDNGVTDFWYDANGAMTKQIDARDIETDYTNDNSGRPLAQTFPSHTAENITFGYDSTASGNKGVGFLTSLSDQSGTAGFSYDSLGHLIAESRTIGPNSYSTSYTYDPAGRILTETYPSGRIVIFTRDTLGRIVSVSTKQNAMATAVSIVTGVTYEPFGGLAGMTYGNGAVLSITHDQDYQLTAISTVAGATTIQNLTYGYDAAGNIATITDGLTSARTQTITYDNLNRVATASGAYGAQSYGYDGVGNRTSRVLGSTTESYSYAATANKITGITTTISPFTTTAASYLYSGFQQRMQKTIGSVTTQFIYDKDGHILAEADGSGAVQKEYIWLDDTPVAMVDATGSSATYFIHTDQLSTPQKVTDTSAIIAWDGVFDPFGNPVSGTGGPLVNLRFAGQYFDVESGLHQNWHREYDPKTGRYLESDPLGFVSGFNLYQYAQSQPLSIIDPLGLYSCPANVSCAFTPATQTAISCFEACVGQALVITGGVGNRSRPGSSHARGEACDLGRGANPRLNRPDTSRCFLQCFPNGYGQEERNSNGGTHFHFQLNHLPSGRPGFSPIVRPYQP